MGWDSWIVGSITIFTIFVITLVLLLSIYGPNSSYSFFQPQQSSEDGNFLSSCLNTPCNEGLICDGNGQICRYELGESCNNAGDCLTGLVCANICATGPIGGLNQLCPCNSGLICSETIEGIQLCKTNINGVCTRDIDCSSYNCSNGVCISGRPNGYPCSQDSNCASDNCSNEYCQDVGIVTGTPNSACSIYGRECGSNTCQLSGDIGTCVETDVKLILPCNQYQICTSETICNDGVCQFNSPNPNVSTNCIAGMNYIDGVCRNGSILGCETNKDCYSGLCTGRSKINVYNFLSGNNFIGSSPYLSSFPGPNSSFVATKFKGLGNILYLATNIGMLTYENQWQTLYSKPVVSFDFSDFGSLIVFDDNQVYYSYSPMSNNYLVLYNGGYQYYNGSVIIIEDIAVDYQGNVLILSRGTLYFKRNNSSVYKIVKSNIQGPISFYRGTVPGINYTYLQNGKIQFTGEYQNYSTLENYQVYNYSIFSFSPYNNDKYLNQLLVFAKLYDQYNNFLSNVVIINRNNTITTLPLQIGEKSLPCLTNEKTYIFSSKSCR